MPSYSHFIGIDIAKDDFVVSFFGKDEIKTYTNNEKGFKDFIKSQNLENSFVCMEFTGGYEIKLSKFLTNNGIVVHKADPKTAYHFNKSIRLKGKTDKIDAQGLARFAFERHQDLLIQTPLSKNQDLLKELNARKRDLLSIKIAENNRLQSPAREHVRESCAEMLKFLEEKIEKIDILINEIIEKDEKMSDSKKILQTIDGVGNVVATALIAAVPELGTLSSKKIASLLSVAPHPKESGTYRGYRKISQGGRPVKSVLFMGAMAASRCKNGALAEFFKRLIEGGKPKKVALFALVRKIVVIANAKIRDYLLEKQKKYNK